MLCSAADQLWATLLKDYRRWLFVLLVLHFLLLSWMSPPPPKGLYLVPSFFYEIVMICLWRVLSTSLQMILPSIILLQLCRTIQLSSLISQLFLYGNHLSLQPTKFCAILILRKWSNTYVPPPLSEISQGLHSGLSMWLLLTQRLDVLLVFYIRISTKSSTIIKLY